MKKFSFRLEPALKHRITIEEKAVLELANWRRRYAELEEQLETMRLYRNQIEQQAAELEGDVPPILLKTLSQHLQWVADQETVCTRELACLALRVEEARQAAIAASTARRSLERLKEKKLEEYLANVAAEAQKELDDHSAVRAARASA